MLNWYTVSDIDKRDVMTLMFKTYYMCVYIRCHSCEQYVFVNIN